MYIVFCPTRNSDLMQLSPLVFNTSHPVYILELGAGNGKFSFLFLKQLQQIRDEYPLIRDLRLIYVLSVRIHDPHSH
jgi:hypothetical protein